MRSYDFDPEQSVSIVAIFMFIDRAFTGFPLLGSLVRGGGSSLLIFLLTRPSLRAKFGIR